MPANIHFYSKSSKTVAIARLSDANRLGSTIYCPKIGAWMEINWVRFLGVPCALNHKGHTHPRIAHSE
jgi:hypothetical protein